MLRRKGEVWSLHGWGGSDRDEYEDELATQPQTKEFRAFRQSPKVEEVVDEKGVNRMERLDLLVDLSLSLPPQARDNLSVTIVSPEGREFNLVGVDRAGGPVGSKRLELMSGGNDASLYF